MRSDDEEDKGAQSPPKYSPIKVYSTIMKKGLFGALEDMEQGPHVHLTLILITIFVVSLIIILFSVFFL
jgi:hypothetical protein